MKYTSIYDECRRCKNVKKYEVAELETEQILYEYKCKFKKEFGQRNCDKFDSK